MKCVLLAWEMGLGLGHLLPLHALGSQFLAAGCELVYAVPNPDLARSILGEASGRFIATPALPADAKSLQAAINYSEILYSTAFQEVASLTKASQGWQAIFDDIQPDLIITEHAPVALLMANAMGLPYVLFGNGFVIPPAQHPLPAIEYGQPKEQQQLMVIDDTVLQVANTVLQKLNLPSMNTMADMFTAAQAEFIASFVELDQYQHSRRDDVKYYGLIQNTILGEELYWPQSQKKKIFIYLNVNIRDLRQMLSQLLTLDYSFIIYIKDLDDNTKQHFSSDNVYFSDKPLAMQQVVKESDVIVCHGNGSTVTESLLAGTPLLMLPMYVEQFINMDRVTTLGAGLFGETISMNLHPTRQLQRLCEEESFTQAAQAFANKYKDFDSKKSLQDITQSCLEIMT